MLDIRVLLFICTISIVGISIFLYGLKKFHLKYSLCLLSKKDKVLSIGVIGIQYILLMLTILIRNSISSMDFAKIEIEYAFLFILSEVLVAMAARNMLARLNKDVNLCYLLLVLVFDFIVYSSIKNIYELIVSLLMAMFLYCLSICVKESFTVKKFLYMAFVFVAVIILNFIWKTNYILAFLLLKNILIAFIMGWIFTKVKRLRCEIKIVGFIIWIILAIGLQILFDFILI